MVILGGGNYLKTDETSNGDVITFKDEGSWIESTRWTYDDGSPKVDFVIKVDFKGEEKSMRLNKTNRDAMRDVYGSDTAEWIGKTATIAKEKVMVAGKKLDCITLIASIPTENVDEDKVPF